MKYQEYGSTNPETIILLHGGGLSWWNYRAEAEMLQSDYHVILPVLNGHADSDQPFTSIEDNAAELVSFIDEACGGSVLLIGGLSLGAQVLLEMLSQRSSICRYALVESACVVPSMLTNALIAPVFGSSYSLVRDRRFAKLQFKSLHMRDDLFEDYYRDTCKISKADMIAFLKASTAYSLKEPIVHTTAQVYALAGEKESRAMIESVDRIKQRIPHCTASILPGLRHGEFSINFPDQYADYLKKMIGSKSGKTQ
ncbi:MAG: alpha/beta hydrolase [Clostridia bacterium]|nr:alpha/beta hydrolase [Clostridia bacterium]